MLTAAASTESANPRPASPDKEYLGGGPRRILRGYYGRVGSAGLDAEHWGGPEQWEMMMIDPYVGSTVRVLLAGILADGVQSAPAVQQEDAKSSEARKERAKDIRAFVDRCTVRIGRPGVPGLVRSLTQILRCAMVHGTGLAEQVYAEIPSGQDKGKLGLDRIKAKAIDAWSFVVDPADNVKSVTGWTTDRDGSTRRRYLPPEKFAWFAWDEQDGMPNGRSALRMAQPAWNMAVQTYPLLWDYLDQFARPRFWGRVGPDQKAEQDVDEDNNPTGEVMSPQKQMYNALGWLAVGDRIALAPGAEVGILQPTGAGEVFDNSLYMLHRDVVMSILGTTRATMESEFGSKADGSVAQDTIGTGVRLDKAAMADMVRSHIYRPLVALNFGDDDAEEFTPLCSLGSTEHQDFSRNASAVARLWAAGFFAPEDRPMLMRRLGLLEAPVPDTPPQPKPVLMPGSPAPSNAPPPANPPGNPQQPPSPQPAKAA